ncbi:MAG: hypothetical protein IAE93_12980 [Ignavibacteria bacterium]|nr:hypothetical protein [Ignavibacteria bacterium]
MIILESKKRRGRPEKQPIQTVLEYIFDKILFPYQREWILDQNRFKIVNKSRQIGFSTVIALEGLLDVLHNKPVYFISRSERQSVHLLNKFYKWCDYFSEAGITIPFTNKTKTECVINNIDVRSLTSKAVTGEGFSGNIYLDEFALHEDDTQIYRSLFPTITWGYNIKIVSRPFGQSNMFYKIFSDTRAYPDYSRHQVDIHKAITQGLKIDLQSLINNIDADGFKENYECEFVDENTAYYPYGLIKRCIYDYDPDKEITGKKFLGIDVGRTHDLTSIITITLDEFGSFHITDIVNLKDTSFVEQKNIIEGIIAKAKPERVLIDKGSVGYQLAEDLEREFFFIKGISMNPSYKIQLATNLKKVMEQDLLRIPDDAQLIADVHGVKKIVNTNNTVSFVAERNNSGHSDRAFALMLALDAATTEEKIPQIRFIG